MQAKVDSSLLKAKLRAIHAAGPAAATAALREGMRSVMADIASPKPIGVGRDTNRLVRGWMMANNKAGLPPQVLPPLAESRDREQQAEKLAAQVDFWKGIVERYEKQGRSDKWAANARTKLKKAEMQLQRFLGDRYSLVVGLLTAFDPSGDRRAVTTTVRTQFNKQGEVHGGEGRLVMIDGKPRYVMHNREPHASMPHNKAPVDAALKRMRASGIKKRSMKKAMAKVLARAVPSVVKAA